MEKPFLRKAGLAIIAMLLCLGCDDIGTNNGGQSGTGEVDGFLGRVSGLPTYTLTTTVSPSGSGSVTRNPDRTSYISGTIVTVTATTASGYEFVGWTGASTSTSASVIITMDGNKTLTANFAQAYTLSTDVSPSGGGSVTRNPDRTSYISGTIVTVTATTASGYEFVGWTGTSTSTNSAITITMDGNKTLTATFHVMPYFTDNRDNKTYRQVAIGSKTWMAENLNYQTPNGSYCYDDNAENCNKYGRLYTWSTAITSCPIGWHLPSRQEWDNLAESVGGQKTSDYDTYHSWFLVGTTLKSTYDWNNNGNGTDDYGFSALPGGYRLVTSVYFSFNNVGDYGYWWSTTERDGSNSYSRNMYYGYDRIDEISISKYYGFSVRCVRN